MPLRVSHLFQTFIQNHSDSYIFFIPCLFRTADGRTVRKCRTFIMLLSGFIYRIRPVQVSLVIYLPDIRTLCWQSGLFPGGSVCQLVLLASKRLRRLKCVPFHNFLYVLPHCWDVSVLPHFPFSRKPGAFARVRNNSTETHPNFRRRSS